MAGADGVLCQTEEEIVMRNPFLALPQDASLDAICSAAGTLFEERRAKNRYTDFNTEIWYLAGDAIDRDFGAMKGMMKEQVAREMGNSISRYLDAGGKYPAITIGGKEYRAKIISGKMYPEVRVKRSETHRDQSPWAAINHGGTYPSYTRIVVDCPYCGGEHWYGGPSRFADPAVGVGHSLLYGCRKGLGLLYIERPN